MRKNIYKAIICLSAGLASVSCTDILDQKPRGYYQAEDVFSTIKSVEGYVLQRYSEIKHGMDRSGTCYVCDEGMTKHNWWSLNNFHEGALSPDFYGNLAVWDRYYSGIRGCNIYLDKLDEIKTLITDNASEKKIGQYTAEIRFIRAYMYAELIKFYGDVPLIKNAFSIENPTEDMMLAREPYEKCLDFIVQELDAAAEGLPTVYSRNWLGRATKGAALALKSRALLYAASPQWNPSDNVGKWEAARKAAKDLIDLCTDGSINPDGNKVYRLDPDFAGMFKNNSSPEIIFLRLFSTEHGHYYDRYNGPNGSSAWSDFNVSQNLVDAFEMEDGTMPDINNQYGYTTYDPATDTNSGVGPWFNLNFNNPWQNRDPRFYATVACDGQTVYGGRKLDISHYVDCSNYSNWVWYASGGYDSSYGNQSWNASRTFFFPRKFMNENMIDPSNEKSNVPWIYMRLGEIFLNYAEASYHCGDEDAAREYIEYIRERARGGRADILPKVELSGQELLDKIRHERRVELAFEEHRYFDVRRWKIANQTENETIYGVVSVKDISNGGGDWRFYYLREILKPKFEDRHYLFPIPRYEIRRNPKLEPNNPGYN